MPKPSPSPAPRLRTRLPSQLRDLWAARWLPATWVDGGGLALVLALVVAVAFLSMLPWRAPLGTVWGDEGTFLAMMESLSADGDLRFDERDAERAAAAEGGRGHLILQLAGPEAVEGAAGGSVSVAYSKPVLFPLLAAPFYGIAGEFGPIVLHLLVLGLALWLARAHLHLVAARQGVPSGRADLALVTFAGPAAVVPYAFWRMADSLQFSLALLGLVLVFGARHLRDEAPEDEKTQDEKTQDEKTQDEKTQDEKTQDEPTAGLAVRCLAWRGAPWVGTVLLAALVSLRVSNGLLALVPVGLALVDRRWRRAVACLALVAASVLAFGALTAGLTGAENPYRAVRATFTPETGYPVGPEAEAVATRFWENRASHFTRIDQPAVSSQVVYSSLYVWVGRHTGLFVYFPASLVLLWLAVRRPRRAGLVALLAFLGTLAFYVGWKPGNYFGGETFLGNRYLLPAYPALLVAVRRLPPARAWLPVWLLALLAFASAGTSIARCADVQRGAEVSTAVTAGAAPEACRGSQNHAYGGIFRWLPFESTSRRIEGVRDRYWAGEFVRFVDPWAAAGSDSFELAAGRPPAELSVAHWRQAQLQIFRVRSTADEATLVVRHGGDEQRFAIGRAEAARASAEGGWLRLEVQPQTPWRRHRFWFNDVPYWVAEYRLHVESPDPAATADLLFLGDPVAVSRAISYEVLETTWPGDALRVTLRNTSPLDWERDDPVRVTLRWRLLRPAAGGHPRHRLAESPPLPLPRDVASGEVVELDVPVAWPREPGAYELEVDLVLEQVAWFGEWLDRPVLRESFTVDEEGRRTASSAAVP